ncbi:MAG: hypothetical protein AB1486_13845 [Planctomycetota bacterium]
MKYEFVVEPGADPDQIRLEYQGATQIRVRERGTREISTPVAELEDARPSAHQMSAGIRSEVAVASAPRTTVGEGGLVFGL